MSWMSPIGIDISTDRLEIIYEQVKEERRFWFDKCLSYMNFYYTINITLFTGYFLANNFEKLQKMLVIMPVLSLFICAYAKKINRICHKQFMENTIIMIKLEYLLGLYSKIKVSDVKGTIPFQNDEFIWVGRHYQNMITYKDSSQYVDDELKEKNRSYAYNTKALNYMAWMSFFLIIYGIVSNGTIGIVITYLKELFSFFIKSGS